MITVQPDNISSILDDFTLLGASDIQLKTGQPPLVALQGNWQPQSGFEPLSSQVITGIHEKICRDIRYKQIPDNEPWDADYRTSTSVNNFRVSGGKEHGRPYLVLRPLPREIPDFAKLKLLDDELGAPDGSGHLTSGFEYVMRQKRGLVLVTGPTGSGKSTTLAALVNFINRTAHYNITTIEDPIEFVFRSHRSHILQREVGVDTRSFGSALRAALRQKPDIILVGEMRDAETIDAAFRAAATGHLVLSTLHNNEGVQTLERIINEFAPEQQNRVRHALSETLVGVFSQQLVPTVDGKRQVIHEAMVMNNSMRALIRPKDGDLGHGAYQQQLRDTLRSKNWLGNRGMDSELRRAVAGGVLAEDVAREFAVQPDSWDRDQVERR